MTDLWQRRPEVAAVRRRSVATLASGQMLASLAIGVGPSVGVLLAAEVTHSEAWAGIARASMTIGAAALALPLAAFAASRGRRPALTLAFSIATLGAIGVALSAQALIAPWAASLSAPLFIVGMLAMGFGSAASFQARFAGADLAEPAHRGRTLALVVWAGTVGAVFGPLLAQPGKLLADRFGWHPFAGAFAIAALLACLTTLLIASFLRPDPLRLAQQHEAAMPTSQAQPAALASEPAAPTSHSAQPKDANPLAATRGRAAYRRAWQAIAASPSARAALIAQVLAHLVMVSIMTMTPVHLHHADHDLGVIGFVISLHVAGMWAFAPLFGYGSDRLGPRRMILIGVAIQLASCAIAFAWPYSTLGVAIALFLLGLGWSAVTVPAAALLTQAVPGSERPYVQGFGDFLMNAVAALGAAISGPVMAFLDFPALAVIGAAVIVPIAHAVRHVR
ncbi:MFS transporter [Bowdeniella nasicola]|uniref:MFS transporter n=1 Tax=Bowdeniella nasicola TaxID=208480 RepID=UPI0009F97FD5|nr:MFS transporter [Bowdeniella nasicola]